VTVAGVDGDDIWMHVGCSGDSRVSEAPARSTPGTLTAPFGRRSSRRRPPFGRPPARCAPHSVAVLASSGFVEREVGICRPPLTWRQSRHAGGPFRSTQTGLIPPQPLRCSRRSRLRRSLIRRPPCGRPPALRSSPLARCLLVAFAIAQARSPARATATDSQTDPPMFAFTLTVLMLGFVLTDRRGR